MKPSFDTALTRGEQRILAAIVAVTVVGAGVTYTRKAAPEWFYGEPDFIAGSHADMPRDESPEAIAEKPTQSVLLDINTASPAALRDLPGIGPTLAERIIAYRTENGGFRSIDELAAVRGIGEKRLATLKPLVTVGNGRQDARNHVE